MRNKLYLYAINLLMIFVANASFADVRRVWDEKPMTIILPVGQEVRVTFPTDVQVQVPLGVSEKLTSLAPNPKMIYWTASEEFTSSRIIATAKDGRTVYVVDIAAEKNALKEDVLIEDPARVSVSESNKSKVPVSSANSDSTSDDDIQALEDPAEIILTRYASQTLYAPSRLMPLDPRIHQVNYLAIGKEFPLLQSGHGEHVSVSVVGSWAGFGRYITAILIINQSPIGFQFDASRVRGNFTHITSQHLYIGAKGTLEDRTTIYVVSENPFAEALTEDSYAY